MVRDLDGAAIPPALIALTGASWERVLGAPDAACPFDAVLAKPTPIANLVFGIQNGIRLSRDRAAARAERTGPTCLPLFDAAVAPARHAAISRILVVEDDAMQQLALRHSLESRGYQVSSPTDGMQAVRLANTDSFHLVLLDDQLPHMDGLTTARLILERHAVAARPRLVGLTAHTDHLMRRQARIGDVFDEVVAKSQGVPSLLATVKRQLATGALHR